jgi:hypothetical protein
LSPELRNAREPFNGDCRAIFSSDNPNYDSNGCCVELDLDKDQFIAAVGLRFTTFNWVRFAPMRPTAIHNQVLCNQRRGICSHWVRFAK